MMIERSHQEFGSIYGSLEQSTFVDIATNRIQQVIIRRTIAEDGLLFDARIDDAQGKPKFDMWINNDLDEHERLLTFVHEVIHIDNNHDYGIPRYHGTDQDLYDKSEQAVEEEAIRFLTEHQDLVKITFEKLTIKGEKQES